MRSGRPTATPMVASAPGSARWRTQTGHRHGLPKARKAEIQVPRKTKRRARALLRRLQKTAPGLEGRPGQCKRAKLGAVVAALERLTADGTRPDREQLVGLEGELDHAVERQRQGALHRERGRTHSDRLEGLAVVRLLHHLEIHSLGL